MGRYWVTELIDPDGTSNVISVIRLEEDVLDKKEAPTIFIYVERE